MNKLTSPAHFALFQKEVLTWIDKVGLYEWEVVFLLDHLNDQSAVRYNLLGRTATFIFPLFWTDAIVKLNISTVKACAKHEVIELLLAEVFSIASARYVSEEELGAAHHALVRRLEKLL